MLDDSRIFPIISSAFALLVGLLWVSGICGRVRSLKKTSQASKLNQGKCLPTEATAGVNVDDEETEWEVPMNIGELTVSKLLVHPIKVGL